MRTQSARRAAGYPVGISAGKFCRQIAALSIPGFAIGHNEIEPKGIAQPCLPPVLRVEHNALNCHR
jgi:hypothetical protein